MMDSTLIRIGGYVFGIVLVLIICKLKKFPIKETLGLNMPNWKQIILYVFLFICLTGLEEWLYFWLNLNEITPWNYDVSNTILRIFGTCILAPICEEMLFRGLMYSQLSKSKLGIKGAILIPAVFFAALHLDKSTLAGFSYLIILQIFVDGLFYGFVRYKTKSIILTTLLHTLGNMFAVLQRLL